MSLHPQCVRSIRTGVRSRRMGWGASALSRASNSGRTRSGWSSGWPRRNIQALPRVERTVWRTWSARVWNPRA